MIYKIFLDLLINNFLTLIRMIVLKKCTHAFLKILLHNKEFYTKLV